MFFSKLNFEYRILIFDKLRQSIPLQCWIRLSILRLLKKRLLHDNYRGIIQPHICGEHPNGLQVIFLRTFVLCGDWRTSQTFVKLTYYTNNLQLANVINLKIKWKQLRFTVILQ